jgi:glutaredoxin
VLLKRYLDYRDIAYQEINVDLDHAAAERLERWTGGYRTVPTVRIGDRVLINPKGPEVEEALAEASPVPE